MVTEFRYAVTFRGETLGYFNEWKHAIRFQETGGWVPDLADASQRRYFYIVEDLEAEEV